MSQFSLEQALQRAVEEHQTKNYAQAEQLCREVLRSIPNQPEATYLLGLAALDSLQNPVAVQVLHRATALLPKFPMAWCKYGLALARAHRNADAISALQRAIALQPDFPDAQTYLATVLLQIGQSTLAIMHLRKVAELHPNDVESLNNLGCILGSVGQHKEAIKVLQQAVEVDPQKADAHANLAKAYFSLGRFSESMESLLKAIEINPNSSRAACDLGVVFIELGDLQNAKVQFEKSIALDPNLPAPRYYLSLVLLLEGEYGRGWKEYEYRWTAENSTAILRDFPQPKWRGEDIAGKIILLHAEQGFGDTIQFVRYAKMVKARGATVLLECQPKLVRLMAKVEGVDQAIPQNHPLPAFDLHCPLISLPGIFETELHSIPNDIPYLQADEQLVAKWKQRLGESLKLRVGIAWSGRPTHVRDKTRSLQPAELIPLMNEDIDFYSLQPGIAIENDQLRIAPLLGAADDFEETAAAVMCMDLIISADTAPLHLAGALGRPTWAMIQFLPDFRWLMNRGDTPWYPTIRLYRQQKVDDWSDVIHRIREELSVLAKSRI